MDEHGHQVAFFRWLRYAHPKLLAFSVPMGGRRDKVTGSRLKAEGAVAGIPDILVARQSGGYPALFIELKTDKGRLSESQKAIKAKLEDEGYRVEVCHGWAEAKESVENYLKPVTE
jgi:VRR-NUC domain